MKKINTILILTLVFTSLLTLQSFAQKTTDNEVTLYFFYGQGCRYCAKMDSFLEQELSKYPSLKVEKFETYFDQENRELFEKISKAFSHEIEGVPTIFINDKVIAGFSNGIADSIDGEIQKCLKETCPSPEEKIKDEQTNGFPQKLTIPAVISAAAVDAINPCAFAVLIILLTTILATKEKKRALHAGLAFSLSVFISYFLMGIGLYSAIRAAGLSQTFYLIVAILAIIIGLFNLKDYLWYGKWFIMEVPISWRPKLKSLLKRITSTPGAFLVGFLVSLFLLPCTSGPYIVILGLLAKTTTKNYALGLLILYNLIFIIPMLIITFAIYYGLTTTEKAEQWRTKSLKKLHLAAGIIILLLGIGMLIALKLGVI